MQIARSLLDTIVEHAVRDAPNECCGVIASQAGVASAAHAMENLAASPFRFEIDGLTLMRIIDELEDAGEDLGAIYHSHTRSDPYPSQTDVNFAALWPGVEWLIVGVSKNAEPQVRSYLIESGAIREAELEVT
ncbi:MAG: [CysO sulfur-carrier protein]-S-L-cysteine hydrolase [Solirubrobacteraceae bacterium]|nr:[CysO sulfur-carrier protein]-S-L-cysteine hydrolase [Solirubrobacteraceae bacterium]